jgi:hypothetical protein
MSEQTLLLALALVGWGLTLLIAYGAGLANGYEDGRDLAESNRIEDLIEEENKK